MEPDRVVSVAGRRDSRLKIRVAVGVVFKSRLSAGFFLSVRFMEKMNYLDDFISLRNVFFVSTRIRNIFSE